MFITFIVSFSLNTDRQKNTTIGLQTSLNNKCIIQTLLPSLAKITSQIMVESLRKYSHKSSNAISHNYLT